MKKRTITFVVLGALVAFAPAIAKAVQHGDHADQTQNAEHQGTHAGPNNPAAHESAPTAGVGEAEAIAKHEGGATEEAEEHGPAPINWWDISNKEQPPYGVMLLNFAILMIMYYSLGKKPVAEGLKARRQNIAKEIEEAQRMRAEAEARAVKYQEKLKHLEVELKETRETMKAAGEAERTRIVKEAEEKAARMEKDARFLVEQELKQMRIELTKEAIEMATAAAEELLKKRITSADQERLAEDYLAELGQKRPSGRESIRPAAGFGGAE